MDKIAVTGPHGRLGSELVRQGCIPIEANILDYSKLREEIRDVNPDVVVHCAAYTDVDGCESSPKHASEVNTCGTHMLTEAFSGKIIYISTDYIFDGENGPYDEDAKPNPISIYGWSKLGGEIVLRNRNNPDDLIIRIASPFGIHSKKPTLALKILQCLQSSAILMFSDNLIVSPSYIPHLAKGIIQASELDIIGLLNLVGDEAISLMMFAQGIARTWGLDPDLIKPGNYKSKVLHPQKGGLIVEKAIQNNVFVGSHLDGLLEMKHALETMAAG